MSVCLSCGAKEGPTADGTCEFCGESASDFAIEAMDKAQDLHSELQALRTQLATKDAEIAKLRAQREWLSTRPTPMFLRRLVAYAAHSPQCSTRATMRHDCSCGLAPILQEIAQEKGEAGE